MQQQDIYVSPEVLPNQVLTQACMAQVSCLLRCQAWAARYNTVLLINLMPKVVAFSVLFLFTDARNV